MKNGSSSESYADFDDEPQAGKMPEPPKKKKKGFSWGKLAKNVLAGLAVAAVAVTAGFAAPVIGGILIGGAIGGVAAVGSMAASDIKRGEVSDITDYMGAGARESFIGALSGATFGPLEAVGLGGKMVLGGVTNAFESVVRQKLNGEDVNWWTVAQDASIGAATGGLFHYGGKAIKGASPYVKKATNKISSALSENAKFAKMAFKNMQNGSKTVVLGSNLGNVDDALKRFGKEFKDVKNAAKGNGAKGAGSRKSITGYEGIERFREKAGLKPYSIDSGDTVASITVNNKTYFGVNSTITKESQKASKELRQKWLKEIEWVPPKKNPPKHLGHAQSLTHAEAHSLIRAYERQGSLPKKVTMYVDRKTCNMCRGELPALLKRLGVDELEIFSGGTTKPIIIKATR